MPKPGKTGLIRIIHAFSYSMQGLVSAYRMEAAFRQEVLLAVILIPASFFITSNAVELSLMIGSVLLVLIVEILNSAIEAVVDRTGEEMHELSGRAKDMGSAAVFLALMNLTVIWLLMIYANFF